ncbi:MAG: DUF6323 family protein [Pseudoflavonifractor sp.]
MTDIDGGGYNRGEVIATENENNGVLATAATEREVKRILACNDKTEHIGLALTQGQTLRLLEGREHALRATGRVEFGSGILDKLILAFYDSPFLDPHDYVDTLLELQDIFYYFKGAAQERLADDELLEMMREFFDGKCKGSLEYLAGTALEALCRETDCGRGRRDENGEER